MPAAAPISSDSWKACCSSRTTCPPIVVCRSARRAQLPLRHAILRVTLNRRTRSAAASSNSTDAQGSTRQARRGVVILPGLGNSKADYEAMAAALRQRGLHVRTAEVIRADWLRNAAGVTDINYWKGTLNPRPVVDWYLERVDAAVAATKEEVTGPITLLAHSAGGWLARVYLLGFGTDRIDRLVTLGSPHNPGGEGTADQTRGILSHIHTTCPGNFHEELVYVTIAGKYIKGSRLFDGRASLAQRLVGAGYQTQCGDPEVWGDGIVPVPAAHLEGAKQVTLEDVYHSPLGALEEALEDGRPKRPWYGSDSVLDRWLEHVVVDASELQGYKVAVDDMLDDSLAPQEAQ